MLAGPDNPLFKRFKTWFEEMRGQDPTFPDPNVFRKWEWPSDDDRDAPYGPYQSAKSWFARASLTWVREALMQNTWKRGDYCELAELLNIVLGGTVRTVFS